MRREQFEELVEDALKSLPRDFKKLFDNLTIMVDAWHPDSPNILGLYHGVPFQHRGPYYGNVAPDVITIYQGAIERICSSKQEVRDKIQEVLVHEVGHYFGFDETQLREIEALKPRKKG
jgi:predicted Zn-dependent protease with MMP-like domain